MPKNPDAPPGFPGYHHDADEPNTAFVRGPASGPFAIGDDLMPPRPSRPSTSTVYSYAQPRRHDPIAEPRTIPSPWSALDKPTVQRRADARITPADPMLLAVAEAIYESVVVKTSDGSYLTRDLLKQGIVDGVTAASIHLPDVTGLHRTMLTAAEMLRPTTAPACFEPNAALVREVAEMLRKAVGK